MLNAKEDNNIILFNICGKEENQSGSILSRSKVSRKVTSDFVHGGIMMVVKGIFAN